jgi:multicomponent K+:H+ antiporter subunit C
MIALFSLAVGVLVSTGVYLMLRPRTFDLILGLSLLAHAVNLFIVLMGRIKTAAPPIVDTKLAPTLQNYADPLPQALVLTAIVIGFAMTAVLIAIAVVAHRETRSDHVDGGGE